MGKRVKYLVGLTGGGLALLLFLPWSEPTQDAVHFSAADPGADKPPAKDVPPKWPGLERVPRHPKPPAPPPQARATDPVSAPTSMLAQYPGFGHDADADEERFEHEEQEREEIISRCMASQGFEYVPAPSIVISGDEVSDDELQRTVAEAADDPNAAYVGGLTEAQRLTYNMTLYGVADPNDEAEIAEKLVPVKGSCLSTAHERVPGVYAKRNLLVSDLEELDARIAADEGTKQAYEKWAACMGTQGHHFERPADIERYADENLLQLLDSDSEAATEHIAAIQEEVDELTKARAACARETHLHERLTEVRVRHENAFVERHRDVLEGPAVLARKHADMP